MPTRNHHPEVEEEEDILDRMFGPLSPVGGDLVAPQPKPKRRQHKQKQPASDVLDSAFQWASPGDLPPGSRVVDKSSRRRGGHDNKDDKADALDAVFAAFSPGDIEPPPPPPPPPTIMRYQRDFLDMLFASTVSLGGYDEKQQGPDRESLTRPKPTTARRTIPLKAEDEESDILDTVFGPFSPDLNIPIRKQRRRRHSSHRNHRRRRNGGLMDTMYEFTSSACYYPKPLSY